MSTTELTELNTAQQQAVTSGLGNLLVIAGAGSGKTRVLVHRFAWLINNFNASPYSVLAVTFTNKAANEMQERLQAMLNLTSRGLWVGTFHGLANRILRRHYQLADLSAGFQVIDASDQLQFIRKIFKKLEINEDIWEPKKAQNFINRQKDEGLRSADLPLAKTLYDKTMGHIYTHYEQACKASGIVDFAELLLCCYELLKNNQELLDKYQDMFRHLLVDEFQDTNTIQYLWLKLLAKTADTVTFVGDDDQSIYGWRGAKIENINKFLQEFPQAKTIRLEQNYRSTSVILSAANALIANNDERMGKNLWTKANGGELIQIYKALNEEDEAYFIIRNIKKYLQKNYALGAIGILYRSNAQSRALEDSLMQANIPYSIYGGLRFFERAEIKDALAYLRLAVNHDDDVSFERVINVPPRGIGEKSILKLKDLASANACSLWHAAKEYGHAIFSGKAKAGFLQFMQLIEELEEQPSSSVSELTKKVINQSGLLNYYKQQKGEKARAKAENLQELVTATLDFAEGEEQNALVSFLSYTALDAGELKNNKDAVQLMTLHAAKGLEFPIVFICGVEEGLFPHYFSSNDPKALEEERRLCYVGITRAKELLHISFASRRKMYGREESRRVSRFISEIPKDLVRRQGVTPIVKQARSSNGTKSKSFAKVNKLRGNKKVRHAKFGIGTIIDSDGEGERQKVCVNFERIGVKWLVLAYAKLEFINT